MSTLKENLNHQYETMVQKWKWEKMYKENELGWLINKRNSKKRKKCFIALLNKTYSPIIIIIENSCYKKIINRIDTKNTKLINYSEPSE